ncbi:DNA modification methylase [Chryseobacterium arthrosphaerae]|uniref:DNA modification methylase n=1 Tax=Chryseobacterium arthrosphaerae TaxID=651561 RepID=UPI0023E113A2|nr:DNA modification methylase [Chryseobacterium arthrosphaerae]WES98290.1 DNA modification methylase [Chryseobacterium arthrosphaerae]
MELHKEIFTSYKVTDYKELYKKIMQFNKNKTAFIHQWYPFVEGYSKEFINSIIEEIDYEINYALDPFAGSGTTPVELQNMGINCHSFEVSPFMHMLATVKLESSYNLDEFDMNVEKISTFLNGHLTRNIQKILPAPIARTFQPKPNLKKWIFNTDVMNGILDIKYAIKQFSDEKYENLFLIALSSILLDISNVYRNGKCLSYKKEWESKKTKRRDVHFKFLNRLSEVIRKDIEVITNTNCIINNSKICHYGDVRKNISSLPDGSIDLVITSPPYLNSRDYTDIYIAELWILDLIKSYDELRALRFRTFRSHVQIKHGNVNLLDIYELQDTIKKIELKKDDFWNREIIEMIKAYFIDMDILFYQLKKKMKNQRKIFFNVANSAYFGVEVKVDEIICAIAEKHGFIINEIREARQLKPSNQQKDQIKSLRESVIVMTS